MIELVIENRSQSVLFKVNQVAKIVEYLTDNYIEDEIDVDAIYDAYNDGDTDFYWEKVGIIIDAIIDYLNDAIEKKEDNIIDAIENNKAYDDEYWKEASIMSDMDKWMWILDEKDYIREYVTIRDVNPYKL